MSSRLYLICVSHDPELSSGEVAYRFSELSDVREHIRRRDDYIKACELNGEFHYSHPDDRFRALLSFFLQHPNCDYQIGDEYGEHYLAFGDDETSIESAEEARLKETKDSGPIGIMTEVVRDENGLIVEIKLNAKGMQLFGRDRELNHFRRLDDTPICQISPPWNGDSFIKMDPVTDADMCLDCRKLLDKFNNRFWWG